MSKIRLETETNQFIPGETIHIKISWEALLESENKIEVHLLWYTEGKGDEDVQIERSEDISTLNPNGSKRITFSAPETPYSFSGKLISLTWLLEATLNNSKEVSSKTITISPNRQQIILNQ